MLNQSILRGGTEPAQMEPSNICIAEQDGYGKVFAEAINSTTATTTWNRRSARRS
jgi:hypothetical protein